MKITPSGSAAMLALGLVGSFWVIEAAAVNPPLMGVDPNWVQCSSAEDILREAELAYRRMIA